MTGALAGGDPTRTFYWVYYTGYIVQMKDEMSGITIPVDPLIQTPWGQPCCRYDTYVFNSINNHYRKSAVVSVKFMGVIEIPIHRDISLQ